jgi:hypothetical protein
MRSRCSGPQGVEADLEREAAQRRFVQVVEQVGGADEDAGKTLHALQHLVDLGHLVVALGAAAAAQEAVGLVEQQHGLLGRPPRTCGPCSARSRRRTCWPGRWPGGSSAAAAALRDVLGQRRLAGAGRAVETQRAVAAARSASTMRGTSKRDSTFSSPRS